MQILNIKRSPRGGLGIRNVREQNVDTSCGPLRAETEFQIHGSTTASL